MHISFLRFLFILFIITSTTLSAQDEIVCFSCGKKITGEYIQAKDKYFHPKHFTCFRCNKVISGSFIEDNDKFYHHDCYTESKGLVCYYCKRNIDGDFIESSGHKFHEKCYKENIASKCVVCGEPLLGKYTIDLYNNKYHSFHSSELHECESCGRLICNRITKGGRSYSDGRYICNECFADAVFDPQRINILLAKIIAKLKMMGLNFNDRNISITGVNRNELRNAAGARYSTTTFGYCNSTEKSEYINNKFSKKEIKHVIYVLNGMPAIRIESIISHELMHVWINENTKISHSAELEEGSCNFISFLYLRSLRNSQAENIIKKLENNVDDVYGRGFQKVRSEFENKNIITLLSYLKAHKS